jgi:peptidoglycan/LPS O-acetylase OafA/YrhL
LILATVIPAFMSTLDYPDLSWRGTLSMSHISLVIIPVLFLALYGYYLLNQYLLERKEPQFKVWFSPNGVRRIFSGLVILFICVILLQAYWNQKPVTAKITFLEQDKLIEDRVMIQAQIFVINTLLGNHGGLLRDDLLPPGMALDNIHHWERGVEEQVNLLGLRGFMWVDIGISG